jgi:hypothetical protein
MSRELLEFPDYFGNIPLEYIENWVSIQSTILSPSFEKKYLMGTQTNDECNANTIDIKNKEQDIPACNSNKKCTSYFSTSKKLWSCVSKNRVKRFQSGELALNVYGQNGRQFRLIESKNIRIMEQDFFYYIYFLENVYYVLFSALSSIEINKFLAIDFDNKESKLNIFIGVLVDDIFKWCKENNKVVLCGHSLGSVLSLKTAIIIKEQDESFFNEHIFVISSAPFKFMNLESINGSKNVAIFAYGVYFTFEEKITIYSDPFIFNGNRKKKNYEPMTFIVKNGETDDTDKSYKIIINNNNELFKLQNQFHEWKLYFEAFSALINHKKTGGNKRKTFKKRKTIKKQIKIKTIKKR